jgi:hypothetical protein
LIRAYKFLKRPTVGQAIALGEMLRDHCSLYNGALQDRRDGYRHVSKTSIKYRQQSAQLKDIRAFAPDRHGRWSFSSQQTTPRRLDKAFAAFFRRIKSGDTPRLSAHSWGELVRHACLRIGSAVWTDQRSQLTIMPMPTPPSSIPVLRGRGGATLRHENGVLTLRCDEEEIRIPLQAVRDVVPDRQTVAVELRAPAGTEPTVHRVEGVSQVPADLFATAVGAALAELPEPDPSLDGATLVTTRSLHTPRPPQPEVSAGQRTRAMGWILLALGPGLGAFMAMSVLVVVNGEPSALIPSVLLGIVAVLLNLVSAVAAERSVQMWLLPRRGITVMAVRTSPYGKSGTYRYTDQSGKTHSFSRQAYASEIEVSYHPDNPSASVGVYLVHMRVLATLGALALWGAMLGLIYLMILTGRQA